MFVVSLPGMKKDGGKESVELVRPFWMQERYHSANVVQTLHLGAQGCFLVKITMDEIAVLLRGDPTHPVNPDATRMADHLAYHVLRHLILVTADGKVGVAPLTPVFTVKNFSVFSFFVTILILMGYDSTQPNCPKYILYLWNIWISLRRL